MARIRRYSAQEASEATCALMTAPEMTARFVSGRSEVSLLAVGKKERERGQRKTKKGEGEETNR